MIQASQFVSIVNCVTKSLNHQFLAMSLSLSPHPSDQLSEKSHVSTTALQWSEVAKIKSAIDLISDKVTKI